LACLIDEGTDAAWHDGDASKRDGGGDEDFLAPIGRENPGAQSTRSKQTIENRANGGSDTKHAAIGGCLRLLGDAPTGFHVAATQLVEDARFWSS